MAHRALVEDMAARARALVANAPPQAGAVHVVFRWLMLALAALVVLLLACVCGVGWCIRRRVCCCVPRRSEHRAHEHSD